jgi:type IV pilus assembly protein PilV
MRRASAYRPGRRQSGFTLIEVLIALLVLAVGLLGLAMLQTMNVRFTQSANYRTQAINLADTLMDQVRSDRAQVASYTGDYTATTTAAACTPGVGAVSAATFRTQWQCQLGRALGGGATAKVRYNAPTLTVDVNWDDDRWNPESAGDLTFKVESEL